MSTAPPEGDLMERRAALTIGVITTLAVIIAIAYGMTSGGHVDGLDTLIGNPWGRVTLVDLAAGFVLAGAWIGWREPSVARAVPWWIAVLVAGNMAVGTYVLRAAWRSHTIEELLIGPYR
jgi:hypothetical protein